MLVMWLISPAFAATTSTFSYSVSSSLVDTWRDTSFSTFPTFPLWSATVSSTESEYSKGTLSPVHREDGNGDKNPVMRDPDLSQSGAVSTEKSESNLAMNIAQTTEADISKTSPQIGLTCYRCYGDENNCGTRRVGDSVTLCGTGQSCWTIASLSDESVTQYNRTCSYQSCTQDYAEDYNCRVVGTDLECSKCCVNKDCNSGIYLKNFSLSHHRGFDSIVILSLVYFSSASCFGNY